MFETVLSSKTVVRERRVAAADQWREASVLLTYHQTRRSAELLEECLAHVQQPATITLPASVEQLSQLLPAASTAPKPAKKQLRQLFYNLPPIGKFIAVAAFAFAFVFAVARVAIVEGERSVYAMIFSITFPATSVSLKFLPA